MRESTNDDPSPDDHHDDNNDTHAASDDGEVRVSFFPVFDLLSVWLSCLQWLFCNIREKKEVNLSPELSWKWFLEKIVADEMLGGVNTPSTEPDKRWGGEAKDQERKKKRGNLFLERKVLKSLKNDQVVVWCWCCFCFSPFPPRVFFFFSSYKHN